MKIFSILLISLLFITLCWYGCSDNKNPLPSKAHPESWSQEGSENFHGAKVLNVGYSSCTSCHGENLDGGDSKVSCFKCHKSYPHSETWNRKDDSDFHGVYLKNLNWVLQSCQECHGQDHKGGTSEVSCYKCHASYPHFEGWLNSESDNYHGTYVLQNEQILTACAKCHGKDETGGRTGISCQKCHSTYPHNDDWTRESSADFHGKFLQALNWSATSCEGCHGTDYKGGSSEVSCYKCHDNYPHTETWLVASGSEFHGAYIKNDNWSSESCQACHGADYQGGTSGKSCYTCHGSYPHSENWLEATSNDNHGVYLKNLNYETTGCQTCHGDNLLGGSSEVSCYKCHENFPHASDWLFGDNSHGKYLKNTDYLLESCQLCHGSDYKGGTSEVSCYKCHSSYPHNEDWLVTSSAEYHGAFLNALNYKLEGCQHCHGEDNMGGSSEVSCYTCHTNYPHIADWQKQESENFHGLYLKDAGWSSESCQKCHGTDYKGGTSNVSCYACHNGYPHSNNFYYGKGNDDFHGNYIRLANWSMDNCKSCHGVDYSGGSSEKACSKCHTGEDGPEACHVCHGSSKNSAPPEDLNNNTAPSFIGVGAHQLHVDLYNSCDYCHVEPVSFDDPNHIDDTPHAEVKEAWNWNRDTATCEAICHKDENKTYIWTNF